MDKASSGEIVHSLQYGSGVVLSVCLTMLVRYKEITDLGLFVDEDRRLGP